MSTENYLKVIFDTDNETFEIHLLVTTGAENGDKLFLAEAQHKYFHKEITFDTCNECHQRYLKRGLLFAIRGHAVIRAKAMIGSIDIDMSEMIDTEGSETPVIIGDINKAKDVFSKGSK